MNACIYVCISDLIGVGVTQKASSTLFTVVGIRKGIQLQNPFQSKQWSLMQLPASPPVPFKPSNPAWKVDIK